MLVRRQQGFMLGGVIRFHHRTHTIIQAFNPFRVLQPTCDGQRWLEDVEVSASQVGVSVNPLFEGFDDCEIGGYV